jgi:iron complex outermembrane recepter protein
LAPNTINKQLQSVSVFLDGVFLGGSASTMDFPEIESIEVLRGPQATQFGRQTYAGAINYRTKTRTPSTIDARINLGLNGNDGAQEPGHEADVSFAFPLITDTLWGSVFFKTKRVGAMTDKTNATRTIVIGREDTLTVNGSLYFKPSDRDLFTPARHDAVVHHHAGAGMGGPRDTAGQPQWHSLARRCAGRCKP